MNASNKRTLQMMFAASVASGSLMGLTQQAQAFCSCMAATNIKTVNERVFQKLPGDASAGWEVPLPHDQIYGYKSDTTPTIFVDFFAPTNGAPYSFQGQACRQRFNSTSFVCTAFTTVSAVQNSNNHVPLNLGSPGQFFGAGNSANDSYYAFFRFTIGTISVNLHGLATAQPKSSL